MHEQQGRCGTCPFDPPCGNKHSMVRVCPLEVPGDGTEGSADVERAAGIAEQRDRFEKVWPSAAIFKTKE